MAFHQVDGLHEKQLTASQWINSSVDGSSTSVQSLTRKAGTFPELFSTAAYIMTLIRCHEKYKCNK